MRPEIKISSKNVDLYNFNSNINLEVGKNLMGKKEKLEFEENGSLMWLRVKYE